MAARICAARARASGILLTLLFGGLSATGCESNDGAEPDDPAPDMMTAGTDLGADADTDRPDADPGPDADPVPDAALDGGSDADAGPVECDPPLGFTQEEYFSAAYDLVVLEPTGGTGNYRFELVENNSDAIVNALTGAYLAGSVEDVVDRVRLWDTGCIG